MKVASVKSIGKRPVYDLSVEEVEHYVLENGVVTHNTGIMYSSDNVWIIGRQQDKDGTDLKGYHFIINVEKSRFVKEKSKIPISVSWDGGIERFSGLLDIALLSGHVTKPSQGWYCRVDTETGEEIQPKVRAKDTLKKEFWDPILSDTGFQEFVKTHYMVGHRSMIDQDDLPEELRNDDVGETTA